MYLMTASLAVCLLTVVFAGTGSQAAFGIECLIDGTAASVACTDTMEKEIESYGGQPYCCIIAKFKRCLSSQLGDSCGRQVEYLVDAAIKNLVFNEASGCKDYEFISVTCLVFYGRDFLLVGGLILLFFFTVIMTYKLLSCCFTCVGNCCRACCRSTTNSKYENQLPLGPAGEPLVVTAPPRIIHMASAPAYHKL